MSYEALNIPVVLPFPRRLKELEEKIKHLEEENESLSDQLEQLKHLLKEKEEKSEIKMDKEREISPTQSTEDEEQYLYEDYIQVMSNFDPLIKGATIEEILLCDELSNCISSFNFSDMNIVFTPLGQSAGKNNMTFIRTNIDTIDESSFSVLKLIYAFPSKNSLTEERYEFTTSTFSILHA
jgi:regulator of replication initiation timing